MVKFSPVLEFILPHLYYIGLDMIAAAASTVKRGALITLVIATSFHKLRAMETHMFVCHIHCDTLDNKHKCSACLQAGVQEQCFFCTIQYDLHLFFFFPVCLIDLVVCSYMTSGFSLAFIFHTFSLMSPLCLLSFY